MPDNAERPLEPTLVLRALGCVIRHNAEQQVTMRDVARMIFIKKLADERKISG